MFDRENFLFPELFLSMDQFGWLEPNNFLGRDNFDSQKYLWLYDMRWLTCSKIINYEYEEEADYIVPFAYTGGGDKWVWYLNDKSKLPVALCPKDDDEAVIYAGSIEAAIFRQILEFVSQNNFYYEDKKEWEMDEITAKKHLINWKNKFKKWFKKEWIDELDDIISKDLKLYEHKFDRYISKYYVFITPEEANEIIEKYIDFDLINKSFIWTKEE
ncbi:hypothetical protein [Clostridium sp. C2-6-12]|uniref:hypothetical protein n=1 Tax=Clostridium sp. C2-6-12 TaxID=2698832 RepID=UPI0013684E96|nr:hypothetical protein [Clostridium sp. C2-6-12]